MLRSHGAVRTGETNTSPNGKMIQVTVREERHFFVSLLFLCWNGEKQKTSKVPVGASRPQGQEVHGEVLIREMKSDKRRFQGIFG